MSTTELVVKALPCSLQFPGYPGILNISKYNMKAFLKQTKVFKAGIAHHSWYKTCIFLSIARKNGKSLYPPLYILFKKLMNVVRFKTPVH